MKIVKTSNYKKLALDLSNLFTGDKESPSITVPEDYKKNIDNLKYDKNFEPPNDHERFFDYEMYSERPPWADVDIKWRREITPEEQLEIQKVKDMGLRVHEWLDGVIIVTLISWIDTFLPEANSIDAERPPYQEIMNRVETWCEQNNAINYGAPRESFSTHNAAQEAKYKGKNIAIVDDWS